MDIYMLIRSGIFLIAGLITIIFSKIILNFQSSLFKTDFNSAKNQKNLRIVGFIFLIISAILFVIGLLG
ncbi:MAG: hypothetical protein ABIF40_00350 [archaeon]